MCIGHQRVMSPWNVGWMDGWMDGWMEYDSIDRQIPTWIHTSYTSAHARHKGPILCEYSASNYEILTKSLKYLSVVLNKWSPAIGYHWQFVQISCVPFFRWGRDTCRGRGGGIGGGIREWIRRSVWKRLGIRVRARQYGRQKLRKNSFKISLLYILAL